MADCLLICGDTKKPAIQDKYELFSCLTIISHYVEGQFWGCFTNMYFHYFGHFYSNFDKAEYGFQNNKILLYLTFSVISQTLHDEILVLKILFRLYTFLCATPQTNGAAATILYMIARTYYLFPCICKKTTKNDDIIRATL